MCILDHTQSTFFSLGKSLKKLADDQWYKGSIYYIKHMYIQPFSMEVHWPKMCCLMEVCTMFYICTYCVFTLWGTCCKNVKNWLVRIMWLFLHLVVLYLAGYQFVRAEKLKKINSWVSTILLKYNVLVIMLISYN